MSSTLHMIQILEKRQTNLVCFKAVDSLILLYSHDMQFLFSAHNFVIDKTDLLGPQDYYCALFTENVINNTA